MINIDHIKKLDSKISNVVEIITLLRDDNQALRSKLETYEKRIDELEVLISNFKKDQSDIENGIINALNQLDKIEDMVSGSSSNNAIEIKHHEISLPTPAEQDIIPDEDNIDSIITEEIIENTTQTTEKQITELDIF